MAGRKRAQRGREFEPFVSPPTTRELPQLLTAAEVAAKLCVQPRQLERLGVPHLFSGKARRYLAGDVLAWLDRQRTSPERVTVPPANPPTNTTSRPAR